MSTAWTRLTQKYSLSVEQIEQFKLYLDRLIYWNHKFNLTAITDEPQIINYHFDDSLALSKFINLSDRQIIADVGSGAGFPGMPLKIMFPHLKLILIEVNGKKVEFLKNLAQDLGLQNVEVVQLDWRAFIHHGHTPVDIFCARASLQVEELARIFKRGCVYKNSSLVYWAAKGWQPDSKIADLVADKFNYKVGDRLRELILLKNNSTAD